MNFCKCGASVLISLLLGVASGAQDEPYPPGTLVPMIDLELRQVPVEVPASLRSEVPEGLTLNLPQGFSVSVFAAGKLSYPRFMAFDAADVLHLADLSRGLIVALPDADGDGVADEQIVAASGFKAAHSLAFYKGDMYVAETHQVVRLHDADGDLFYEEREVFIADIPSAAWHSWKTIVFDEINDKIYLSVGSPCDLCRPEAPVAGAGPDPLPPNPEWGTVLEFNADGTGRRIFSSGVRNVVGMDLHPLTNELWGNNNGHDLEGRTRPPEWIDIMRAGDFLGYPFAHSHQVWNDFDIRRYQRLLPISRQDSLLVQQQKRPVALVPAHYAPMGLHFYTHDQFPSIYKNAAFVAFHAGKAKLSSHEGYNVSALFSDPDGSNARMGEFITGFQTGRTQGDVWGFPQGLASDRKGNLYLTSDLRNKLVLRISHSPLIGAWEHSLPDSILSGARLAIAASVHLERVAAQGDAPQLYADLSALGGPANVPLVDLGDRTYQIDTNIDVAAPGGLREIRVYGEQKTPQHTFEIQFAHSIVVMPSADLLVFADALNREWMLEHNTRIEPTTASIAAYRGATASAFHIPPRTLGGWNMTFLPSAPFDQIGYKALRFAFHPGDMTMESGSTFEVSIANQRSGNRAAARRVDLLNKYRRPPYIDLGLRQWQVVEIPLRAFAGSGAIEKIGFSGTTQGTFLLDEIRLLTDSPSVTAVREGLEASLPQHFALQQNYPNPFNNSTLIRFALPQSGRISLAVYNLLGQRVATLAEGVQAAGFYAVEWDGRSREGAALATGVYFYRLQAGEQTRSRKLLLLQ